MTTTVIQPRRGTAAQWTSVNPVLAVGEMGFETDTDRYKFGDGTTAWTRLDYSSTPYLAPARFTAAGKADGALSTMDTGQAWSVFGNFPSAISGGYVKHTPTGTVTTASYCQVSTGNRRPTRIICRGRWTGNDGNDNAALTLVVPISAWGPVGGFPADSAAQVVAGIHSTFFRNGIHTHSRWNVGNQTIYADSDTAVGSNPALGRYAPVPVGQVVTIEIWVDYVAGTMTFFPPQGGKPIVIQDNAIKNDTGPWAIWEQFEFGGTQAGSPFEILEMDYDVETRNITDFHMTKLDLADAFAGLVAAGAEGVQSTVATGSTKALTSDSPRIQVVTTGTPSSTNQTLQLPPSLPSAQPWFIVCAMSGGTLTVNTSNGTTMISLTSGQVLLLLPLSLAPTAPGNWSYVPIVSTIGTQTLTATRVNPRIVSATSSATLTPNFGSGDVFKQTAQAVAITIAAPANTTDGHRGRVWIKDNGSSQTITWNAAYVALPGVTLPTATTAGKWVMVEYEYNLTASTAFVISARVQP